MAEPLDYQPAQLKGAAKPKLVRGFIGWVLFGALLTFFLKALRAADGFDTVIPVETPP